MVDLLTTELETFEKHRHELMGRAQGKFALVRGGDVVGVFDTKPDAISAGYRRFGNEPFLVKQVSAIDAPQDFVSSHLAL